MDRRINILLTINGLILTAMLFAGGFALRASVALEHRLTQLEVFHEHLVPASQLASVVDLRKISDQLADLKLRVSLLEVHHQ